MTPADSSMLRLGKGSDRENVTISMQPDLLAVLDRYCERTGLYRSQVAEAAIARYVIDELCHQNRSFWTTLAELAETGKLQIL